MNQDFPLTDHFSFFELTRTDRAKFQELNRKKAVECRPALTALAILLEQVRDICGYPIQIHSAFRCMDLNEAIGGSKKSQHMLGEAADFSAPGPDTEDSIEDTFQTTLHGMISKGIDFGQFIIESQETRFNGRKLWLHLSLGSPFRPKDKCGEVLRMKDGKYEMLKRIVYDQ